MRTTTVVWDLSAKGLPEAEAQAKISVHQIRTMNALAEMGITDPTSNLVSETLSADGNQRTVVRGWPDLATAEKWIGLTIDACPDDCCTGSVTAVVDPE